MAMYWAHCLPLSAVHPNRIDILEQWKDFVIGDDHIGARLELHFIHNLGPENCPVVAALVASQKLTVHSTRETTIGIVN